MSLKWTCWAWLPRSSSLWHWWWWWGRCWQWWHCKKLVGVMSPLWRLLSHSRRGISFKAPLLHPHPAFCREHCRAISIVERCRAISTSGAPVRRRNRVAHILTSAIEARFLSSQFIRHRQHRCSTCFLVSFLQLNVYMVCYMVQSRQDI